MATVILPASRTANIETFSLLDEIMTLLGNVNTTFWPFLASHGPSLQPYGSGVQQLVLSPSDEAGILNVEDEFEPHKHPGGVYSYHIDESVNNHLRGVDNAAFSFGDATVDLPFSVGCFVLMTEAVGNARSLLAKYRATAAAAREWDFRFDAAANFELELFDESVDATEIATSDTVLTPGIWQCVIAAYDGGQAAPIINLFLNGGLDNDGTSVEAGAYVAMEDTATPLLVAARDLTATPAQELEGRIALPFVCGRQLGATQAAEYNRLGRLLLGL